MPLPEIAVLARAIWHLRELELELGRRNIPYVVFGGIRFSEAAHIKDALAYLRVAVNPKDDISVKRILELLPRVGAKTSQRYITAMLDSADPWTALADPANLKWRELVTPGTPIPTPWEREAYDRMEATYQKRRRELNAAIAAAMRGGASDEKVQQLRSEADTLSRRQAAKVERYLAGCRRAGEVGAFEGAG